MKLKTRDGRYWIHGTVVSELVSHGRSSAGVLLWLNPSSEQVWSVIGNALRFPNTIPVIVCRKMNGSGFTGSATLSRIALNDDGGLLRADPSEDSTPKPITKARLEGSVLHITVMDGFEFIVTLKDDTHAEIHPKGAPPNMKPIPAERVH